jgi:hypothetical protein
MQNLVKRKLFARTALQSFACGAQVLGTKVKLAWNIKQ